MIEKGRKKVLIITATIDFGGAERTVVDTAKALVKSKKYYPIICSLTGRGDMEQEIKEFGVEYYPLQLKNIKNIPRGLITVSKLIKQCQPDIIHTHQGAADFYGSIASIGFNIPVISHIQNPDMPQPASRKIIRRILSQWFIDYFIPVNEEKAEGLVRLIPSAKNRLFILYNTIDPKNLALPDDFSKESYRERQGIPKNAFVVGSVGRMVWEKGYDLLIPAFKEIFYKRSESFLVLVGDGPELNNLKNLTQQLGIADKVLFAGYCKDISTWMSLFDIFVVSSKLESFPLVSLEALHIGLPVIITDQLSSKEILSRAAMIVPCSIEGLQDGISKLIKNHKLREEMSSRGREMIEKEFLIDKYIEKLESIYNKILHQSAHNSDNHLRQ